MKPTPLSRRDRLRQILADLRMPGALEMRSSRLPAVKQLRDFDFTFQPSLRREQIDSLREPASSSAVRMSSSWDRLVSARPTWRSASRLPLRRAAGASTTGHSPT
jgi:hypothetical protein